MQGHIPRTLAKRIVCDENILTGKPVIKGTRLAVEFIIGLLGHGWTEQRFLRIILTSCKRIFAPVLRMQARYYIRKKTINIQ